MSIDRRRALKAHHRPKLQEAFRRRAGRRGDLRTDTFPRLTGSRRGAYGHRHQLRSRRERESEEP